MSVEHGYNRYSNGCRCEVCRAAKAQRQRESRAAWSRRRDWVKTFGSGGRHYVDGITHGYSGYANFHCRCEVCTAAKAAAQSRAYRQRRIPAVTS